MEGKEVVPIQAMTSVLYLAVGLLSTLLFLQGRFTSAFIVSVITTQGWRSLSEVLRADYRGNGRISAYQLMGLVAIFYSLALILTLSSDRFVSPKLDVGIDALWRPEAVLFLQALWAIVFIFFGKSMVTGAEIFFHLHEDRI
jgi:hypothetical protein